MKLFISVFLSTETIEWDVDTALKSAVRNVSRNSVISYLCQREAGASYPATFCAGVE